MNTRPTPNIWRLGLLLLLACVTLTQIAEAGNVAPIPVGPWDATNNKMATPDYYTTANWANSPPLAKFVDTLPGLGVGKTNNLGQYLSVAKPDITTYPGSDYYEISLRQFNKRMHSDLPVGGTLLRGYVQTNNGTNITTDTLPSENKCGPVATPHPCAADGSENTLLPDPIQYLGGTIISERDRPVRIKFTNELPRSEDGGDLFIPVDTTVMGAGPGPANMGATRGSGTPCDNTIDGNTCASYTQNRATVHLHGGRTPWISDGTPHQWITPANEITPFTKGVSTQNVPDMPDPGDGSSTYYYTNQQSARLMFYHDHAFGITRLNVYAGEASPYLITDQYEQDLVKRGIIPADEIPLVLQDKTFVDANDTTKYIYNPVTGLFDTPITVPKVRETDPLWNWGSGVKDPANHDIRPPVTGDLWMSHVYMPAQIHAAGFGGVNPYGRWMYGPWFYPATNVTKGPVANPYYDADCSSTNPLILADCQTPGQPPLIPGTPNVSMGMEAFQDSAIVNGTAFPTLTVDPRAYRFRILNAASDRFWNLSFYEADSAQTSPDPRLNPTSGSYVAGRSNKTEVKILPASANLATANNWPALWPVDGRDGGVPDPAFRGPSFLQIGTDSGFLPQPAEIVPQPITYNTDPTAFWVGNVDKMGLALGPAERADAIVDFSAYAGKTLILYNDAPAAWPARVAGYDYYTDAPDMRDSGGFGTGGKFNQELGVWEDGTGPMAGYAPNTRTVMQVIVRAAGSTVDGIITIPYTRANLEKEFTKDAAVTLLNPTPAKTLFERSQEPIIVGQPAYKSAYPNSYFPTNFPYEGVAQINDQSLHFVTLAGEKVIIPTEPKGIHDEMGASFDPVYGRMSGNLAMQLPNPTTLNALLVLYGFSDLPTETVNNSTTLNVQVVPDPITGVNKRADGTQIWKISHNGVDTHPIHFHIFDVQLINRVGWDGQVLLPEPNELGWKEVVKISPLEDTIVAVRPRAPALPFGITNSLRPLNPAIPLDSGMGFNSVDWQTGQARNTPVTNILYDFGWEYVWHCHILNHEEMDMMRPIVLKVVNTVPGTPAITAISAGVITWTDPTPITYTVYSTYGDISNEIGFNVYRSTDGTNFTKLNVDGANLPVIIPANSTSYTDTSPVADALYKIEAFNAAGSSFSPVFRAITVTVAASTAPFTAPATVVLEATFTLPVGVTATQVAFYNGTTQIGIDADTAAPYTFSWTNVPKGDYSVTARVTDNLGGVTTSAPITVTVTGTITADFTATGAVNGLANIGFCESILFASTSTGPVTGYSWSINGNNYLTSTVNTTLPVGTYPVTLGVVNSGTGETNQITKNVTVVNHPPVAIHGGPYTVAPGNSLPLFGSGTDPDACNATPLTYAWNIDNIGVYDYFTANPTISYNVLNRVLGGGSHTITFKVTDSNGGVGTATTTLTVEVGTPALTVPVKSETGSYTVSWAASATTAVTYILEESTDNFATYPANTTTVTSGITALSAVISGKANGTLYYRVKAVASDTTASAWATGANGCTTVITVITAPTSGSFVTQGIATTITATAAPTGPAVSTVTMVRFYENGIQVGIDSLSFPYTASWTPATLAARTLTAITTYSDNSTSTSAVVPVTVLPFTPSITLDTPTNGATYDMGTTIALLATPTDIVVATVLGVEFYDATTLVGYAVTSPFSVPYTPTATGLRSLTAKVYYSNGAVATSAVSVVTVNPAIIVINGGTAITASRDVNLTISATGADRMSFSNDGNSYSVQYNYTTANTWQLSTGDGLKDVYVKFYNTAKNITYDPVKAQIILDTAAPVTTSNPAPATFIGGIVVNLSASEAGSTIRYTTDGTAPTAASTLYTGPISIGATTTLNYFATDVAGNAEVVKGGTYTITSLTINALVSINSGAEATKNQSITLTLAATGVDKMSFSNDGVTYSTPETYATAKNWTLSTGDGVKTVFVRFSDTANSLTYDPKTAQIMLDTTTPATTSNPAPATFIGGVNVTLSASEAGGTIRYTMDGTAPTAASTLYTGPINIGATTTLNYFATDGAGNAEVVKGGTYTITSLTINALVSINSGAAVTTSGTVTLALSATGVDKMSFSNDGVTYTSPPEAYATSKNWDLSNGEGAKTVFVRFHDTANRLTFDPVIAQITLAYKDGLLPGTTTLLQSSLRTLQISNEQLIPTALELAHADVAPYYGSASHPDGIINLGDVSVLLMRAVGSILGF